MGSRGKKRLKILIDEEDKISRLPDELIHKILSFTDAKEAVQTSVLSQRWELVWTTLPVLNFGEYINSSPKSNSMFIRHVLSNRNRQSDLSKLDFRVYNKGLRRCLIADVVRYAISHNLLSFNFRLLCKHKPFKLSTFNSNSLKKLTLRVRLELESSCWDLPALTTLYLKHPDFDFRRGYKILDSWFTCFPALGTLGLKNWDLSVSSFSFSFPDLKTLRLYKCILPNKVWDLPALTSLGLHYVILPYDMSDMISTLTNLQNLTISSPFRQDHVISCPRPLLNLNIRTSSSRRDNGSGKIVVLAPKLCNFTSFGIFATTFAVPELENVIISLQGWFHSMESSKKKLYHRLTSMLPGLGNAKTLTFDLESIEALNEIYSLLACFPSPFCNLMYVKVPRGYKGSNMSSALRRYLLGGSPSATIVTTLPQIALGETDFFFQNMLPQVAVSMTEQNGPLQDRFGDPIKELDNSHNIHQTLSVDTVNMNVEEEQVMEHYVVGSDRFRHNDAPLERTQKDQERSSQGNVDSGLWLGHEVNPEFVCLLNRIMHMYPETFEQFTTKNKMLCAMTLNMLCTSLNDLTKISVTEVDLEMIVGYKDVFAHLQNQGLDVSWAVNRLNYIEHLRFSNPLIPEPRAIDCSIDDAKVKLQELQAHVKDDKIKLQDLPAHADDTKTKLQDLQTLHMKKMTEIEKAFGAVGTNLADCFIGDYLLSAP